MLSLDLRALLFGLLLVIAAAVGLALWLDRHRRRTLIRAGTASPMEHAPFGWIVLNRAGICRYANACARRILGLRDIPAPLPDEPWAQQLTTDRIAARREPSLTGYSNHIALPSGHIIRWWIFPHEGEDHVFFLDITAQHRTEQAVGSLFSGLSHELRTPIGTILTHLEVLSLPALSEELRQQSLRLLKMETQRMARLVNQMLELGRLDTTAEIDRRPVYLPGLVEYAVAQTFPYAEERGIALSSQIDPSLPPVLGDADRLMQVFLNLLDNAVKYSRPGDQVTVVLQQQEEGVECVIEDTGPGIPAEHLPYITRRFYRAAPQEVEGSGLGLALVEEILHRHGSRLEIESRTQGENTGTRVRFVLPVVESVKSKT